MQKHRLDKLARLTKGAALISMGAVSFACQNDTTKHINNPPEEPIHINSPAPPMALDAAPPPDPNASANASGDAGAAPTLRPYPHTINAPPRPRPSSNVDPSSVSH
jgi:hypothetical protein